MSKMMKLIILIPVVTIILDQITKQMVTRTMELGESIPVINNFLYITYYRNAGASFGILQGQILLFHIVTFIAIIGIIFVLTRLDIENEKFLVIALTLFLGGVIGNFIDRVIYQNVIDFVHTVWWGWNFAIFNVADSAMVVAVVLLALEGLVLEKRRALRRSTSGNYH